MDELITSVNWIYRLTTERFINYVLSDEQEKKETYDDDNFFKSLPKKIIKESIKTIKFLETPISNDKSIMDDLLKRYLKYKEKEIKSIKHDIIKASLQYKGLEIVFVSSYDSDFCGSFNEIHKTCFTLIIKHVKDNVYEIVKYVYVNSEYKDMYDVKTIQINDLDNSVWIEKYGMGCREFEIYKRDYFDLFGQRDDIIENIIQLMDKTK
jgi:hypothetical protein